MYKVNEMDELRVKLKIKEKEHRGEIVSFFGENPNDPEKDYLWIPAGCKVERYLPSNKEQMKFVIIKILHWEIRMVNKKANWNILYKQSKCIVT